MPGEPSPIDVNHLNQILQSVTEPFWHRPDFWIGTALGIAGLVFSVKAFLEAKKAAVAAREAGRTVKIQTTTVDLTEFAQRLSKIQPKIRFVDARDLLDEVNRRLRRAIAPFAGDPQLKDAIGVLKKTLQAASEALAAVRPTDAAKESEAPDSVYNGVEGHFRAISDALADLVGLFEKKGFDFGEIDGQR
ncbi:MAG TPA: hypothetical protein VGI90_19735 [Steroidobacteraceae bacterium]|jgi:hypothetical protein